MFLFGPLLSQNHIIDYFRNVNTYKYFLNAILILQHDLPGVFLDNIYTSTVNGALWTLPVEFVCYTLCFLIYKIGMLNSEKIRLTFPIVLCGSIFVCCFAKAKNIEILTTVLFPMVCFYVGVIYCVYKKQIRMSSLIAMLFLVMFILMTYAGWLKVGFVFFLSYCLIYFSFGMKNMFQHIWKIGNWSYAMYLCGFPIQQAIVALEGGKMNPYTNILIALPITIVVSIVLYFLVEHRGTKKLAIKK